MRTTGGGEISLAAVTVAIVFIRNYPAGAT